MDMGSNGGTYINNKRISKQGCKSQPKKLISGDIVQLGQDYVENDINKDNYEFTYKCVKFEILIPESVQNNESKRAIDSIIDIYSNYDIYELSRAQSDGNIGCTKASRDYENVININKEKAKELYDLIDESTKNQLELYEKTKNMNDEYSNISNNLFTDIKETGEQFFFVIYSDKKKINRIQILNSKTECIFEIALKDWMNRNWKNEDDNKGKIHIIDRREEYSPTSQIKFVRSGKTINVTSDNYMLGFIEKDSDMKYNIEPPTITESAPQFCITGDFEQQNWLCITKYRDSRKQKCIGEGKGKQLVEKNVKARKWVISVQLETGNYSQLLLSALTYIIASTGPYY